MNMNTENERLRKRVVELEKLIHESIPFIGYTASVEDLKTKLEAAVDYPFRYMPDRKCVCDEHTEAPSIFNCPIHGCLVND